MMLAGDQDCAAALAKWTLSGDLPAENAFSQTSRQTHGNDSVPINLRKYIEFATSMTSMEKLSTTPLVEEHREAVQALANGGSVWYSVEACVEVLACWCKVNIVPCMSSTHRVEAQVREANLVATTGRDPNMRSAMALIRSTVDKAANQATNDEHRRRVRKGNQHMGGGKQGGRELISSLAKRKQRTNATELPLIIR
jgi:hypothetical protein